MQMAKVGVALTSAETGESLTGAQSEGANGVPLSHEQSVKPQAFKTLVGKGHPEFSSNRQQVLSSLPPPFPSPWALPPIQHCASTPMVQIELALNAIFNYHVMST